MATKEAIEQQIEQEKAKLEKLKKLLKQKEQAEKAKERKERNHRLIKIGGIVEKYAGEIIDLESFEAYVNKYAAAIKKTQSEKTDPPSDPDPEEYQQISFELSSADVMNS